MERDFQLSEMSGSPFGNKSRNGRNRGWLNMHESVAWSITVRRSRKSIVFVHSSVTTTLSRKPIFQGGRGAREKFHGAPVAKGNRRYFVADHAKRCYHSRNFASLKYADVEPRNAVLRKSNFHVFSQRERNIFLVLENCSTVLVNVKENSFCTNQLSGIIRQDYNQLFILIIVDLHINP